MKYRKINVDLNREYRNDLNWNFQQIADDIENIEGISDTMKQELLDELETVKQEFDDKIDLLAGESLDALLQSIEDAKESAYTASSNANLKAQYAEEQGDYAKDQGDYAKNKGDYAQLKGDYADDKAILADDMASLAQQEINNLDNLKVNVVDATQSANTAANNADNKAQLADDKAQYAEEKGDYAKTQGIRAENAADAVDDLLSDGSVASVNGKTGIVNLTAEDVGAETPQGAQSKANQALTDANQYTDTQISNIDINTSDLATKTELTTHINDTSNPHNTTKSDVGLSNVLNKEQLGKNEKAVDSEKLDGNTLAQVRSGVTKANVGLSNVDNIKQASKTEFNTLQQDYTSHKADISTEEGRHGIRFWQGKFEVKNNGVWEELDIENAVISVNGKTGEITISKSDVGLSNVLNKEQLGVNEKAVDSTLLDGNTLAQVRSGVTKATVGLGSVQNYGLATLTQARAGTVNTVYMTPQRTADFVNDKIKYGTSNPTGGKHGDLYFQYE